VREEKEQIRANLLLQPAPPRLQWQTADGKNRPGTHPHQTTKEKCIYIKKTHGKREIDRLVQGTEDGKGGAWGGRTSLGQKMANSALEQRRVCFSRRTLDRQFYLRSAKIKLKNMYSWAVGRKGRRSLSLPSKERRGG